MNKPNTFFTIEIPHTRPAQVCAWPSKQDAVENFGAHLELTMTCDRMTDEEVFEAAGDDLSSFHTFDSLKELDKWSERQQSQHQGLKIRAQVDQLLEDEFVDEVIEDEGSQS